MRYAMDSGVARESCDWRLDDCAVAGLVSLSVYDRYVFGNASNGSVGWDFISLFGRYWKLGVIGIPLLIFGLGCSVGFWFLSKRVHG